MLTLKSGLQGKYIFRLDNSQNQETMLWSGIIEHC